MEIVYAQPINNKDKADNETSIYRSPEMIGVDWEGQMEVTTLHEVYKKRMQSPQDPLLGSRKKLGKDKFEN